MRSRHNGSISAPKMEPCPGVNKRPRLSLLSSSPLSLPSSLARAAPARMENAPAAAGGAAPAAPPVGLDAEIAALNFKIKNLHAEWEAAGYPDPNPKQKALDTLKEERAALLAQRQLGTPRLPSLLSCNFSLHMTGN